ncbi:hypothetical protein [Aurantiacibacter hainanensis]|uniref:hypothetical protein n=1 Tax=Aurantiacibacter hainanensis TaxID=3076114 RepID=UPI0030C6E4B0
MSLFESSNDKRDRTLGLAGLLAGIQSLRILAERGIASRQDMEVSASGVKQVLEEVPANSISAEKLGQIDAMLDAIVHSAEQNFGKRS